MNTPIAELVAGVAPHVVDCPAGVLQLELRRAVSRFLNDSGVWQVTATEFVEKGENLFAVRDALVDLPAQAYVRGVMGVRVDGRDVPFTIGRSATVEQVRLQFALIRDAEVQADCMLGQSPGEPMMDAGIAARYGDAICLLARGLVYALPGRPYTDLAAHAVVMAEYHEKLSDANLDRVRGGYGGDAVNPLPEYI